MIYLSPYRPAGLDYNWSSGVGKEGQPLIEMMMRLVEWTAGRNVLAKAMYKAEQAKGLTYKYWIFTDHDVVTTECDACKGTECGPVCLRGFMDQYLRSGDPPVVGYGYTNSCHFPQWQNREAWAVDAMMNAFHRQAVPFLLPYSTRLDQESWWESQAFLFYIWSACLGPNHPTIVASWCHYDTADNEHEPYPGGKLTELQPVRRQILNEEIGSKGIDLLALDFPFPHCQRDDPESVMPFNGGSQDITWYSQNGRRWWEFYESRLCTVKLHDRFMAAVEEQALE